MDEGLPGRTYIGAERGGDGVRRTKVRAAAMAEIADLADFGREEGGNGQEVGRRNAGSSMRASAWGREA